MSFLRVDRHSIPGPVDGRGDLLLAVAVEVFIEETGTILRGPPANVRVPGGDSAVPSTRDCQGLAVDQREMVVAVWPPGDEEVAAAVPSGHEQEHPTRPPEYRRALDQLSGLVQDLQCARTTHKTPALPLVEGARVQPVDAFMARGGLEPVGLGGLVDGRIHLGGEDPLALAAWIEGDDLFIHAAGQQQVVLVPPAEHADLPIGFELADLLALGREKMDCAAFGDAELCSLRRRDGDHVGHLASHLGDQRYGQLRRRRLNRWTGPRGRVSRQLLSQVLCQLLCQQAQESAP